jgi:prepilin-type N-terminal cleavage/methylation domain-containing protein
MTQLREERGATLLELLVVLALLGVMGAVVGLAGGASSKPPPSDESVAAVAAARREALESGRRVVISLMVEGRRVDVTASPDGGVQADTALPIESLTGRYLGAQ